MKPENFVCNLTQSRKLKELGIIQETYFHWHFSWNNLWVLIDSTNSFIDSEDFAAYSETELAVMLCGYYETFRTEKHKWDGGNPGDKRGFNTPAEASADRLIWLLKNYTDSMTVAIANERLSTANKM